MIVFPRHTASTRLALPVAAATPARTLAARAALVAALVLGAPATALAGGGVSLASTPTTTASKSTTTKAKAAAATDDPGIDASDAPAVDPDVKPRSVGKSQVRRAQTLLRVSATGSNDATTRKVVKRFQILRGLAPYGIIDLATYVQIKNAFALLETGGAGVNIAVDPATAAGGASVVAATTPATIALPPNLAPITPAEKAILDKVAQCESQGNPAAVSSDGTYRGKYQFDRSTWKAVGGTGDPAAASETEQDQRAAILLRQRGTAPWPVCSLS
ncbi:MAG: transglycosylase family protein [Solirubrobacteraceae bacterium]|nr:transglycosylase family protein [Patulibacter sp.]